MIKQLRSNTLSILIGLAIGLTSCGGSEEVYVPKPLARNHIELPEHTYTRVDDATLPYVFEYSKEAQLVDDTVGIQEKYWKKLYYPQFQSEVDITYKSINNSPERLDSLIRDAYKLVDHHDVKATGFNYKQITLANGNPATLFTISGEVPTTFQFFTHDSTTHFMRCSLYFPTALKNDSLQPVIDYCIHDMEHMMNSLEWRYNK